MYVPLFCASLHVLVNVFVLWRMQVPSEESTLQDMTDMCLAEYLSETHGDLMSPSGRHPVTYIVCQTGDYFNLYCLVDRDGSSASSHHELLFRWVGECETANGCNVIISAKNFWQG